MSILLIRVLLGLTSIFAILRPTDAQEARLYQPKSPVAVPQRPLPTVDFAPPSSETLETRLEILEALSASQPPGNTTPIDVLDRVAFVSSNGFLSADLAIRLNLENRNIYCVRSVYNAEFDFSRVKFELKWPSPGGSIAESDAVPLRVLGVRNELLFVEADTGLPTPLSFDFRSSNVPSDPSTDVFLLGYDLSLAGRSQGQVGAIKIAVSRNKGTTGERWQTAEMAISSRATGLAIRSDGRVWGLVIPANRVGGVKTRMTIVPFHEIEKSIRPELLEEPIEVPTPVHSLNSAILSASPHGAGALAVFVNEPFWIRRIPAETLAR